MENFISFYVFIFLLLLGYVAGRYTERRHWRSIHAREQALSKIKVISDRRLPNTPNVAGGSMVVGSVVIGQDYYLAIAAALKNLIGGHVKSYEGLFTRARREAILRMKEQAVAEGNNAVYNVKFSTMNIASRQGNGIVGVEVIAYGTALTL